ncbi:Mitochondrial inner membrane protein oxa1 [Agyrium rufum]|nr:Mitochondrial inner membrane protein oxa1 [Agyrium rufum]
MASDGLTTQWQRQTTAELKLENVAVEVYRLVPPLSIASISSIRFASTTTTTTTATATSTSIASPVLESTAPLSSIDAPSSPLVSTNGFIPDEFVAPDLSDTATRHIGYLHELGLDFGWGPTSIIQYVMEHIYAYTSLPWGLSIVCTALLVRSSILPLFIRGADQAARMQNATPMMKPIQEKLRRAKEGNDLATQMALIQEMKDLKKGSGLKFTWLVLPMLLQFPLGFGSFRLLRNMADLPVPGFEAGGFLWLEDLTLSDPYLILPAATASAFYVAFKFGGEMGMQAATSQAMRVLLQYIMPLITGVFMCFWPAGLQIYFFTSSMFSLIYSACIRRPTVRRFLNLTPVIKQLPPSISPAATLNRAAPLRPSPVSPFTPTSSGNGGGSGRIIDTTATSTSTLISQQPPSTPSQTLAKKSGLLGGALDELTGAASELAASARKQMARTRGDYSDDAAPTRLSKAELQKAKEYEERKARERDYEQERSKDEGQYGKGKGKGKKRTLR